MRNKQLEQRVLESKEDKQKLNDLLEAYKPFIASCTQKINGKYLQYGEDDELSVGMLAFVQAVKGYQPRNGDFLSYAGVIIRNKVIDYYRSQKKHSGKILYLRTEEDDAEETIETKISMANYGKEKANEERLLEIQSLKEKLEQYGIQFFELEGVSPKNKQTRLVCTKVISIMLSNRELLHEALIHKSLPLLQIEKILQIKRKKFERHRKYILAVLIIKSGDYPYLSEYVKGI